MSEERERALFGVEETAGGAALLRVEHVTVRFGGVVALDDVSFDVRKDQICGLIGPNGAGKTTLFNCLSRLYNTQSGSIAFDGQAISSKPVHAIAGYGIGRTFQNLAIFKGLTVERNVMVGAHCRTSAGFWASALRTPFVIAEERKVREKADGLMGLLDLRQFAERRAGDLPFGIQKRIEFARALAAEPTLLLLDEPAAGLNHEELGGLADLIRMVRDKLGITVLLVEHHMGLVMSLSDHIVVLNFGRKIAEGPPDDVKCNPAVIEAYLGSSAHA